MTERVPPKIHAGIAAAAAGVSASVASVASVASLSAAGWAVAMRSCLP